MYVARGLILRTDFPTVFKNFPTVSNLLRKCPMYWLIIYLCILTYTYLPTLTYLHLPTYTYLPTLIDLPPYLRIGLRIDIEKLLPTY